MLKKLCSFLLILITMTVHAGASTHNGLKLAFDELNYSLSVEWDQKDQKFFHTKTDIFMTKMKELRAQGLTNQEMFQTVLKEVKDKKTVRELETTFSLVSINSMSPDEAEVKIKNIIEKSYSTGASWNGTSVIFGMVLMIVIIAAVGVIYKDELKKEGEKCYMAWKCHDYCTLTGCQQVCGEECI